MQSGVHGGGIHIVWPGAGVGGPVPRDPLAHHLAPWPALAVPGHRARVPGGQGALLVPDVVRGTGGTAAQMTRRCGPSLLPGTLRVIPPCVT
jgi:hypothetical protein